MKTKGKGISALIFSVVVILIGLTAYIGAYGLEIGGYKVKSFGDVIKRGLDLQGGISILSEVKDTDLSKGDKDSKIERTIGLLEARINPSGVSEIAISKEGTNRIRIDIPGEFDLKKVEDKVTKPGTLKFEGPDKSEILTGNDVKDAKAVLDQNGKPIITLKLNTEGAKKFATATAKFLGQPIAIYMDDKEVTSPTVNAVITDGNAIIEGSKSFEEAKSQANMIKSGALPVTLTTVSTKVVGPTLGATALPNSIKAGIIGIAIVLLFMMIYYRVPGILADIALILYAVLVLIAFVLLDVTLSLSGIAAFLLTVGMAVDANILIFERMKEELKSGKSIKSALDAGFHRALSSILDSQITTIIAGIVLYWLGSGPVKGFALTLVIGCVINLFTALTVTRFLVKLAANMGWFNKEWTIGTFWVVGIKRG